MSNMQDQPPDSQSQSTGLEEIMSSVINYDDYMFLLNKKPNLERIQRKAFYDVLHAFSVEAPAISSSRILIIQELKDELKIPLLTRSEFDKKLKDDPLVKRWRKVPNASDKKEEQKVTQVQSPPLKSHVAVNMEDLLKYQERLNVAPATIHSGNPNLAPATVHSGNPNPSSASEDSLVPSWGQVSPESLVGRWVNIKMPGEEEYTAFHIKNYNAETEMHHLVTALSQNTFVDPCDWIDIRYIPKEDIVWKDGHPGFPARKCFLKPGETILSTTTSTAKEKKQIPEVGKTANGIPIIKKLDKGKGIAV